MRLSQGSSALSATFDDPNLVSVGRLAPVLALAQSCRLGDLVAEDLTLKATGGVNAPVKVPALVAGKVAGADSIEDMDLLRHGGMDRLFAGIRAPSTLGTSLRASPSAPSASSSRWPRPSSSRWPEALRCCPAPTRSPTGPGRHDGRDPRLRHTTQGAGYGYNEIKGLNALLATISTPLAVAVIGATRLRRGRSSLPAARAR